MSKVTCLIEAQYHENYNTSGVGEPIWKAKMGHTFTLKVDADLLLYAEAQCIRAFHVLLEGKNNEMSRYTFLGYELIFSEPTPLNSETFEKLVQAFSDEDHKKEINN